MKVASVEAESDQLVSELNDEGSQGKGSNIIEDEKKIQQKLNIEINIENKSKKIKTAVTDYGKYTGWLRERDFKRVPLMDFKNAFSLNKKKDDVPIRWMTVPLVIIFWRACCTSIIFLQGLL